MASYIKYITEKEITHLDIKDLNKILKIRNIPKCERREIKEIRRSNKMTKYRRDSRMRTDPKKLEEVKLDLQNELFALTYEVVELRQYMEYLISKQESYPDEDGYEYEEFVIVD
ncbi:hypothetical protein LOD99_9841 [Oopsacas minuta]|uniref:Basic leucine zipper domain-containing protein n=1 Tax=Oopsacas minuta TaxID=111878 RepID=A0AAV7KRD5_9METZ|nr:hypothetical protein LOD99_9841 [Oopsacas minuta]